MARIFLDIETTGFDPKKDEIIEIAAIKTRGTYIEDVFQTLVCPRRRKIPKLIQDLTGISQVMVEGFPTIERIRPRLLRFIGNCKIISYNAPFEQRFLSKVSSRIFSKDRFIDYLKELKYLEPNLSSYKLEDVVGKKGNFHRALNDVFYLYQISYKYGIR